ncbi:hypothetical protein NX862_09340 [Rhodobacter sp. KR11]|jgi:hypothetical protein|uniref:hypothetical protein n=1 Tax=Rhodobacter sp. KR11 TaxID=2974588 RepID=UPI002222722B|nr:hypothetical protein [Rhodobacter sp. KR11]MCW1918959.1 hypothetical protein [Rhodobacter sp. KR11]
MTLEASADESLYIPARLAVGEAQDHRTRLLGLIAETRPFTIEFTESDGCAHPSAVSLQLCLATAAQLTAAGLAPQYGPEARRLLSAQKLL